MSEESNELTPVDSTVVAGVAYDEANATLTLQLRDGSTYKYFDVPRLTYLAFMKEPSKGKAANRLFLRGVFRFEQLR